MMKRLDLIDAEASAESIVPRATAPSGPADRALIVDLDGTLIHGDTLAESAVGLMRTAPEGLLPAAGAALKGRAALKRALAERYVPQIGTILNHEVLDFVRAEAEHRHVVLATAADAAVARAVADELGVFDAVIASTGSLNLKGRNKLEAVRAHLAAQGLSPEFDYIGDSPADRPMWQAAGRALVVAPSPAAARRLAGDVPVAHHFEARARTGAEGARAYLRAMRPHQWVKNSLVFLPLVLSHQLGDPALIAAAVLAFCAFSLVASATYIWNDTLDLAQDRRHPTKRARPLASGSIPVFRAVALSFGLLGLGLGGSLLLLPLWSTAMLCGYVAVTLTYSFVLKRKLLVDVITLASLYGYRIVVGAVATGIMVSDWLIAFCVFFFFGLALVKRYAEIDTKTPSADGRISGRGYYAEDGEMVGAIGVGSSLVSVLVLALYATSPDVSTLYASPIALWGVCLVVLYWVARVWMLARRRQMADDPVVFALRDRISWGCAAATAACVLLAGPL
ncbi:UbiA family prenyltransferase [Parvularcula dongshanensis]|uniref:4-hydroxybenzoate polyprenyltransferase/phosphoserine phosphatase n=1 Tax=Parvularcula dongshanensis TaxID=1173995 RepID=A0A840HZH2_9PROT|nr:UbiA family prenyltransferase [Parvularcula dongshanensis]MBB4657969.1 4-hydroxybenzoate polyprenyltransferase/phosphoserine phosphatase [Parvularcula dongshanensis]